MANLIVVGAQWGDEGKGKIVDILAEHSDIVVRYGGGYSYYYMIYGYVGNSASQAVTLSVNDSIIEESGGTGILVSDENSTQLSSLTISNSILRNNSGRGAYASGLGVGTINLNGSTFSNNGSDGAFLQSAASIVVSNSIFSNNRDEFFRVRVATLTRMLRVGKTQNEIINSNGNSC
jgi:hypothetical protein